MHARFIAAVLAAALVATGCCNCMQALEKYEERSKAAGGDVDLSGTFDSAHLGFSIKHPEHWGAKSAGTGVVVIGGLDESKPDFTATVNIQMIEHDEDASMEEKVQAEIDHLKSQIIGAENGKVWDEEPFSFEDADGVTRKGTSMMFEYDLNGNHYKQRQIVLPGKEDNVVVTWAYTNLDFLYDEHVHIAEAMLETWKLER